MINYSPNMLKTFKSCPLKYKFKYIDKISLPQKSSFFEKGKKTENIWYYRLEMPEGYKHFSKTRPMLDIHFDPVRVWWNNREISDVSQLISIDEIKANNYNLDFCGFPHEEEEILNPYEFINNYMTERKEISENINNLLQEIQTIMKKDI